MATIGQVLAVPEAGYRRYDDTDFRFRYSGTWSNRAHAAYYKGAQTIQNPTVIGNKIEFRFLGSKLRIITSTYPTYASSVNVTIDGVVENYSLAIGSENMALVYEKEGLEFKEHTVVIERVVSGTYTPDFAWDAIDIDATGQLLHKDEVTKLEDLQVGRRIRCHYEAITNAAGIFSGLGKETSDLIPPASSATPNGDFYFIMVEDWNGKKRLIADRNIQHGVSWDTLNTAGIASGVPIALGKTLTMTSATSTDGEVVSSGSLNATYNEWKAFDRVNNTYWCSTSAASESIEATIGFKYNTPQKINKYKMHSIYAPLSWVFEASNDGSNWTTLHEQNNVANWNGTVVEYSFVNDKEYNIYRIRATKRPAYTTSVFYIGFYEVVFFEEPKNVALTARLLTGGVSAADKDNEWDKYIVGSTLGGNITAGDNNVWNWSSKYSWSSTTTTPSTYRAIRGSTVSGYDLGSPGSQYVGANVGFRPVLEIESLFSYKVFIFEKGAYKKWTDIWTTVSTSLPTEDMFNGHGMSDLLKLNRAIKKVQQSSMSLASSPDGQVFKSSISLSRYKDVRTISIT